MTTWNIDLFPPTVFTRRDITNATPTVDQTYAHNLSSLAQCVAGVPDSNGVTNAYKAGFQTILGQGDDARPMWIIPSPDYPTAPVFLYDKLPSPPLGTYPKNWGDGATFAGDPNKPASYWQQSYFASVPVPITDKKIESTGSDHATTIWDPFTDKYWETWQFGAFNVNSIAPGQSDWSDNAHLLPPANYIPPGGWYYAFGSGGHVKPSQLGPDGLYPDLPSGQSQGAGATNWIRDQGHITHDDIFSGTINHAIKMLTSCGGPHWIPPVTRGDSTGAPNGRSTLRDKNGNKTFIYQIPEGSVFRFRPDWNIPTVNSQMGDYPELVGSHLSPYQLVDPIHVMIWRAMQEYGFYFTDQSTTLQCILQSTVSLDTPFSRYTLVDYNTRMRELAPNSSSVHNGVVWCGGNPVQKFNPLYTAPWTPDIVQQLQWNTW